MIILILTNLGIMKIKIKIKYNFNQVIEVDLCDFVFKHRKNKI
jgi:hypothetical protein